MPKCLLTHAESNPLELEPRPAFPPTHSAGSCLSYAPPPGTRQMGVPRSPGSDQRLRKRTGAKHGHGNRHCLPSCQDGMRRVHPVLATGAGPAGCLFGNSRSSCRMNPPLMMAPWQPCGRQAHNAASATKQPNAFSVERSSYVRLDSGDPTTQSSSSTCPHGI